MTTTQARHESILGRPGSTRRWILAVLIAGLALGLIRQIPVDESQESSLVFWGLVASSSLATTSLRAQSARHLISALVSVGLGIAAGAWLLEPCTPLGLYMGPPVGFLMFRFLGRRSANQKWVEPGTLPDPTHLV